MNIKKIIKSILSPIMCTIHGIHYEGGIYWKTCEVNSSKTNVG